MHISEGVLSAPVLIGGGVLTGVGTAIGLRKIDIDEIMTVSILTATFFVASLIHVPIGPGSIHLVLNGLLGLILGWACFPAILIALLLQAFFFQYGGLAVLGVNSFIMAFPAIICFYLVRPLIISPRTRLIGGFLGGAGSIIFSAVFMAASLALSDTGFLATAKITIVANLPIMVIEGFVTMFAISFLARVHPDILPGVKK